MIDVAGGSNVAHADEVHRFVSKQHHACMNGGDARKFNVHVADEVPVLFERLTETSIACDDLTGCESLGLRFVEAGQCRVPPHGKAKSVHLRFVSDGTNCRKGTSISVFIQPYVGYIPMEEGHAYRLDGEDDMVVYGWVRDHVVYYVVANAGEPCEVFRRAAGLPEPEELPDRS
jgi:hypothetical protein